MMIDLIMDIFGPMLLDQAKSAVTGPPGKGGLAGGTSPEARAKSLERDHERLKLVTMALWELLSEKLNVSEDELRRRIEELDLLDERRDGRLHFFDDLGCALLWLTARTEDGEPASHHSELWVRDAANERWIDGFAARYEGGHRTPMGYGFAASAGPGPGSFGFEELAVRLASQESKRRDRGVEK